MKQGNGIYQLSYTDRKRAEKSARALAKRESRYYSGSVEVWFNQNTGNVSFEEHVGNSWCQPGEGMELICRIKF